MKNHMKQTKIAAGLAVAAICMMLLGSCMVNQGVGRTGTIRQTIPDFDGLPGYRPGKNRMPTAAEFRKAEERKRIARR